jgi:hypothetical protein
MIVFTLLSACNQRSGDLDTAMPKEKSKKEKIKEMTDTIFVYRVENGQAVITGIRSFNPLLIEENGILTMSEYIGKVVENVVKVSANVDAAGDSGANSGEEPVETFGGYKINRIERISLVSTPAVPAVLDEQGDVVTEAVPELPLTLESDCIKAIKTLVLPVVPSNGAAIALNPDDIIITTPPDDDLMHWFSVNGKNWYLGGKKMKGIYSGQEYKNRDIKIFDMRYVDLTPEAPVQTTNIGQNGSVIEYDSIFATAWKGVQNSIMERIIIPDSFTCLEQFVGPNMANSTHTYFFCDKIFTKSGKNIPQYLRDVVVENPPVEEVTPEPVT